MSHFRCSPASLFKWRSLPEERRERVRLNRLSRSPTRQIASKERGERTGWKVKLARPPCDELDMISLFAEMFARNVLLFDSLLDLVRSCFERQRRADCSFGEVEKME